MDDELKDFLIVCDMATHIGNDVTISANRLTAISAAIRLMNVRVELLTAASNGVKKVAMDFAGRDTDSWGYEEIMHAKLKIANYVLEHLE